jgi:hypothetical protein
MFSNMHSYPVVSVSVYQVSISISSTFYARLFCTKVFLTPFLYLHVIRKKLLKALSYERCARKMLMKLNTGCAKKLSSAIRCTFLRFLCEIERHLSFCHLNKDYYLLELTSYKLPYLVTVS